MSSIGWIDFSSEDRARVQHILDRLKEPGTLDELGIGQVRDAFSDALFPGFSTIQTRARYFLAVPKIMLDWADRPFAYRRRHPLAAYLRDAENELARTLKANYEALGLPPEDVIGHTVVEQGGVARRPSSTYWNGLRVFQIIDTPDSLAEFCKEWRQGHAARATVDGEEGNDESDDQFEAAVRTPPYSRVPWRAGLTLDLDKPEADFLAKRFQTAAGVQHSVAAQLLSTGLARAAIRTEHKSFAAFSQWASRQRALSEPVQANIRNAQRFSAGIEGAHIIFNRLVAELLGYDDLRSDCIEEYKNWHARVAHDRIFHAASAREWLQIVPAKHPVHPRTVHFLESWSAAMHGGVSQKDLDALVAEQAKRNKPGRSLLARPPNKKSRWYGMKDLAYRWPTARRMLHDIVAGQKC